jgi:hypothetical protein
MPPSRHQRRSAARRSAARRSQARRSTARNAESPRSSAPRRTQPISTGANRSRTRRWLYLIASSVIALLVIAGFALGGIPLGGGGGGEGIGYASEHVRGIGEEVANVTASRDHFPVGDLITQHVPEGYLTTPPTSGRHWGQWVSCGFFTDPVPDENIVHNMEHGNIVLSYNLAEQTQIDELKQAFDDIDLTESWGVARPYDAIDEGAIALTTWGIIDRWSVSDDIAGVDKDRIARFFEAYSGRLSPEFPDDGQRCTSGGSMIP